MPRLYIGTRHPETGVCQIAVELGGCVRVVDPRHDLRNHSSDGFNWGYGGSGPAQAALAVLADCLDDDELAQALYQPFKWAFLAKQTGNCWTLGEDQIRAWVAVEGRKRRLLPPVPEGPGRQLAE